ncbi:MAG: cytochrome c maturation protein CcmE [Parvularculaceae bacterium]
MTKKQKRSVFMASLFGLTVVAIGLVLTALNQSISYFYTPSELNKLTQSPDNIIRLGGLVVTGSVTKASARDATIRFAIADKLAETRIEFEGILPDLFREGQGVIVQGRLSDNGIVIATEVLAKHDETYMPREVADALKKQGRWQEGSEPE